MRISRQACSVTAIIVFLALVLGWIGYANIDPIVAIPKPPPLPNPNAYDYFDQAGTMGFKGPNGRMNFDPSDPLPLREQMAAANAPMFAKFREGFQYPYMTPPNPRFHGPARRAKLLRIEGSVRADHGDIPGAITSNLDNIHYGIISPRGSGEMGYLVGTVCETIGQVDLWVYLPQSDAKTARAAAHRLEQVGAKRVPIAEMLTNEKCHHQQVFMDFFHGAVIPTAQRPMPHLVANIVLPFAMGSRRGTMREMTSYYDQLIAESHKPFSQQRPVKFPSSKLAIMLLTRIDGVAFRSTHAATQTALLTTAFALRAYRLEHGTYPAQLTELTPAYLTTIPADPFADTAPLQYKKTATGYLLYSIGPDGNDNNGTPSKDGQLANPGRARNVYSPVTANSLGDIVAGVNVP